MAPLFESGQTMLFQGDSITDASRDRADPHNLGRGYAMIAAAWFSAKYPELDVTFLNRGISGNRAADLERRWQDDCLALRPDWLSLMIGVNDTWRRFDRNDPTSPRAYAASCRTLLEQARDGLGCRIILMEPFVLPYPEDRRAWREDLEPRIEVIRDLAEDYDALLVPLDRIFQDACTRREPAFWAADGVHPTPAGHGLIAQSWLNAVQALG